MKRSSLVTDQDGQIGPPDVEPFGKSPIKPRAELFLSGRRLVNFGVLAPSVIRKSDVDALAGRGFVLGLKGSG